MMSSLPPGLILILGGLCAPLLRGRVQALFVLLLPVWSLLHLLTFAEGVSGEIQVFSYSLVMIRVDSLSLVFGYIFHIAAFLGALYSLHLRDSSQHVSGMVYAGSAIAAVFAGDLITLFVFWELTAISSVFLIWASRSERAYRSGMRYLIIQVASGMLLLIGTVFHFIETGSLMFESLGPPDGPGSVLIFLAFGVKCAFPFLHNWLQDAYPEGTVTGTVFLSAFTTKLAIYALARGFPGTQSLIWIGATMTVFPIFFAVIENDLRKVLAYSLNNQLGFMVVGIGIGTEMALNGAVAHAFCHILYKALLFMSMGAVLYRTGTTKVTELGGLYRSMPMTAVFCIIGAVSISAFPLFSGFVSKSMTISAAVETQSVVLWLVLLVASAGVVEHSGIKIPYFSFFGKDAGIRCKEAPAHMLLAMGLAAFLCVYLGCFPGRLYELMPYRVDYQPYTAGHVLTSLQLLLFAAMAFAVLIRTGLYPHEIRSINLDTDWIYRRAVPRAVRLARRYGETVTARVGESTRGVLHRGAAAIRFLHGPGGILARTWSTGGMVIWAALLLGLFLVLYFLG